MCLTLTVAQVLKGVNAAAAGLMASAFLMLWLKVIKDSAPRAASAVFLLALQLIFSLKAPQVIGIGSTFNKTLFRALGELTSTEARGRNAGLGKSYWAPNVK